MDAPDKGPTADVLVIFGITGDLARKQTWRALYRLEYRRRLACHVIGVARDQLSDEQLVALAREAIENSDLPLDE